MSQDLVSVHGVGGKTIQLHHQAAGAWQNMLTAARVEGVSAPMLLPISGYRSPERQARLWQRALKRYGSPAKAREWVAPPGRSAHQTGRAIDFYIGGRNSSGNVKYLRQLPVYRWLVRNAERFGFYPYAKEPWHWEYNPRAP
jgi:LAS superfamily LD-carboxypeptidase LdcB